MWSSELLAMIRLRIIIKSNILTPSFPEKKSESRCQEFLVARFEVWKTFLIIEIMKTRSWKLFWIFPRKPEIHWTDQRMLTWKSRKGHIILMCYGSQTLAIVCCHANQNWRFSRRLLKNSEGQFPVHFFRNFLSNAISKHIRLSAKYVNNGPKIEQKN